MAGKRWRPAFGWLVIGAAFVTGIIVVLARGTRDGRQLGALTITLIVVIGVLAGAAWHYGRRAYLRWRRIRARRDRERAAGRLVRQANDEALRGLYDEALATYDRALDTQPDRADAFAGRGAVLYERGEVEAALDEYRQAIELDPRCLAAFFGRANGRMALGRVAEAIADYDIALSLAPLEMPIVYNRGVAQARRGEKALARLDLARVVEGAADPALVEAARVALAALDT